MKNNNGWYGSLVSMTTQSLCVFAVVVMVSFLPFLFSALFPDVINCMQTGNSELKKLVYLYLMNYAKTQPDMAIMAVNTFVKVGHITRRRLLASMKSCDLTASKWASFSNILLSGVTWVHILNWTVSSKPWVFFVNYFAIAFVFSFNCMGLLSHTICTYTHNHIIHTSLCPFFVVSVLFDRPYTLNLSPFLLCYLFIYLFIYISSVNQNFQIHGNQK